YLTAPPFAVTRFLSTLEQLESSAFDLLTLLEVVEHLTNPMSLLKKLRHVLKPTGALVISTEIYRPGEHDASWSYLAPQGGQHVTFWSIDALQLLRRELDFKSMGCFPGNSGFLLIFSSKPEGEMKAMLNKAYRKLKRRRHFDRALASFDFRSDNIIS